MRNTIGHKGATLCALTAGVPLLVAAWACSPSASDGPGGSPGSGGAGSAGPPNGAGGGTALSGSGGDGTFPIDLGSGGMAVEDLADGGCFATASAAENVEVPKEVTITTYLPFDMYVIYDQSGSMNDDTPQGTRWDAIKAALTGFVNDTGMDGSGVGIGYFPFVDPAAPPVCFVDADCGAFGPCVPVLFVGYCQGADACLPSQYGTPDVPIEVLPAVGPKIVNSVNRHRPGGGTPTAPALQGALDYAIPWAAAHPDRKTIVVLATDGNPSGCNGNSVQDVANIAATGAAANPPVLTFVIGVGNSLGSLNAIAASGGTGQAFIVDAAGNPTQDFLDAMNAIRESVTTTDTRIEIQSTPVPCEWKIPTPPEGETFDTSKVNVDFATGANGKQRIGAVGSAADCAHVSGGWHYDDPGNPTKVLVCPQTCQVIQGATDARVDVLFGCATEPARIQ
jgi:hypothetical protein